jgi:hypothetical protein
MTRVGLGIYNSCILITPNSGEPHMARYSGEPDQVKSCIGLPVTINYIPWQLSPTVLLLSSL